MKRRLVLAGLLAALLAACGADDRDMRPPSAGQTTSTRPTTPSSDSADSEGLLQLSSPAFKQDGVIPPPNTCQGEGLSPQLQWANVPRGTVQLAIIVRDIDVEGTFIHWVVSGIDPALGTLVEGQLPPGTTVGLNESDQPGWGAPCPPPGTTHRYDFLLYALSEPVQLSTDMTADEAAQAVEQTPALGTASLVGTVTR